MRRPAARMTRPAGPAGVAGVAGTVLFAVLTATVLAGCSGDSGDSGGSGDAGPADAGSPSPSASAPVDASSGPAPVAAYRELLTATFSGSQDLDDRAVALAADGVSDPEVMVRRLNAIAAEEGLAFRVRAVAADDVADISCYEGADGLWLSSSSGTDSAVVGLGEGTPVCDAAAARYLLRLSATGDGVTVAASDASEDLDGARVLARAAQGLIDGVSGTG